MNSFVSFFPKFFQRKKSKLFIFFKLFWEDHRPPRLVSDPPVIQNLVPQWLNHHKVRTWGVFVKLEVPSFCFILCLAVNVSCVDPGSVLVQIRPPGVRACSSSVLCCLITGRAGRRTCPRKFVWPLVSVRRKVKWFWTWIPGRSFRTPAPLSCPRPRRATSTPNSATRPSTPVSCTTPRPTTRTVRVGNTNIKHLMKPAH